MKTKLAHLSLVLLLAAGCGRQWSSLPFDAAKWADPPPRSTDRIRMLSAVTNMIKLGITTEEDILKTLGTNTIPAHLAFTPSLATCFYESATNRYDMVYFLGDAPAPGLETAWIYLCLCFDARGVCTNVIIHKPSA